MRIRNVIGSVSAGAVLLLSATMPAMAATSATSSGNGLRVSPLRTPVTVNTGTSQTVSIMVQDVSPGPMTVQAVVNDFEPSNDESGSPQLLLNNQPAPSHSLKKLTGSIPNFTLQANEEKTVTVTITVPKNYPGGGYYGAIRFVPAGVNPSNSVSLSASVASLILVTVPGNYKEQMSIASMDVEQNGHMRSMFSSSKNLQVAARFQNSGDVQEQPFGKIQVKKGSKVVGSVEINNTDPRGYVLPSSIRKFTTPLKGVGSFGKYTVEGNFGYANGQLLTASASFWVVPTGLIALGVLALVVLALLIFVLPRIIRRHDRGVLRRAGRR